MHLFYLNNHDLRLTFSDWGASWLSAKVNLSGEWREVLTTTSPSLWQQQTAYFGATIGRYANRIANACYQLNNQRFQLNANNGVHNLHGGVIGADKQPWQVEKVTEQAICFHKIFANGEEGFGGEIHAWVEYRLHHHSLYILFEATTDQDTPLCLTNHAYFNLSGSPTILQHQLRINADYYLPVNSQGIPNAPLRSVTNTGFDFRTFKTIGQDLLQDKDQQAVKGYDHGFLLAKRGLNTSACTLLVDDLQLDLFTTKPVVQIYSGNWLAGQPNLNGGQYPDYAGIALEAGYFADTPNHPEWWHMGGITSAQTRYQHQTIYQFTPLK